MFYSSFYSINHQLGTMAFEKRKEAGGDDEDK